MATVKDIVLIHLEDAPVSFARIESIEPDVKKDWYQIRLLMLQVPLQTVTWILKGDYINGEEFFMNGKKMKLALVESPAEPAATDDPLQDPPPPEPRDSDQSPDDSGGNVISFSDFKKKQ